MKFSNFCDQQVENLAMEVVAACLAGDLRLPIPTPFLVAVTDEWISVVPDEARKRRIANSSRVAFGSQFVTGGYSAWTPDTRVSEGMVDVAAHVFAFDAIAQNPDRRSDNPNCLVRGENIRIIDHDLTFAHHLVIGWRAPWLAGGLNWLEPAGKHIFRRDLRGGALDFETTKAIWKSLGDSRVAAYGAAVPPEWAAATKRVESALKLIRDARDNIDGCIKEIKRVLA